MQKIFFYLAFCLYLFFGFSSAQAQSKINQLYAPPKLVAVEDRENIFNHGVTARLGILPVDAFNKGVTIGASYSYYFSEYFAWEVANFNYNFNYETGLKSQLLALNTEVTNTSFNGVLDYARYYVTTNLVYTPIYNKNLLFNESIVPGEVSFVLGGGVVGFEATGNKPLVSAGLLLRYFVNPLQSVVLDVREHIYYDETTGANGILELVAGYSFQLGTSQNQ